MNAQHTPGPWKAEGSSNVFVNPDNVERYDHNSIAQCYGNNSIANASLIAEAPRLLEACEAFVIAWEKSHQLEKTDVALRLAKQAIAKVKGEENGSLQLR